MNNLIQKARKEWCEIPNNEGWPHINVCPPEVVAALLGVLDDYRDVWSDDGIRACCTTRCYKPHEAGCSVALAEAAIERALEAKHHMTSSEQSVMQDAPFASAEEQRP